MIGQGAFGTRRRQIYVHHRRSDMAPVVMTDPRCMPLPQVIRTTLLLDNIKHGLGTEPTGPFRSDGLVCVCCVLVIDFRRFVATASGSGIRHELRVTALLQAHEPEHGRFNASADGQEPVVLEKSGLFASQCACNLFAFLGGKDDAVEL